MNSNFYCQWMEFYSSSIAWAYLCAGSPYLPHANFCDFKSLDESGAIRKCHHVPKLVLLIFGTPCTNLHSILSFKMSGKKLTCSSRFLENALSLNFLLMIFSMNSDWKNNYLNCFKIFFFLNHVQISLKKTFAVCCGEMHSWPFN